VIRRPPRSTPLYSSAASDVYKRRLRRTNEALADLVFSDVPGRVAKALLDLSARFGEPAEDGLRVAHDLTQEELAQLVGASRETVNKALADFAARGWVQLDDQLDLHRRVQRQDGDADGTAGVHPGLPEHLPQELARAVDHHRLPGEGRVCLLYTS